MNFENKFLVIIPARTGSKGIFEKNMQLIGNKPLIQFTIEAALANFNAEDLLVTSNDQKVLDIAIQLGLKIPFKRPDELSTDTIGTADVIMHALHWYEAEYKSPPKNIILLQPTSPFRDANDIRLAVEQFNHSKRKTLISATDPMQHPGDCILKNQNGQFKRLEIGKSSFQRQSYPEVLFIDGGIYISEVSQFLKTQDLIGDDPEIYKTEQYNAIDIDTQFDLELARAIYNYKLPHDL